MVNLDSDVLLVDPDALARGDACAAARQIFRTNHIFKIVFWTFVAVFAAALTVLLVVALYLIIKAPSSNVGQIVASGAGAIVSGVATGFLTQKAQQSSRAENAALRNIAKYCDNQTKEALRADLGGRAAKALI